MSGIFWKSKPDVDKFLEAAKSDNVSELRKQTAAGVDKDAVDNVYVWVTGDHTGCYYAYICVSLQGWTALMWAANNNAEEAADYLLSLGADANRQHTTVGIYASTASTVPQSRVIVKIVGKHSSASCWRHGLHSSS
jgi:hypothetical protein